MKQVILEAKMLDADALFQTPLHKEVNCPWIEEDGLGNMHMCAECEDNEMLFYNIQKWADELFDSGVVGVRNLHGDDSHFPYFNSEENEAMIEAHNMVVKEMLEEV